MLFSLFLNALVLCCFVAVNTSRRLLMNFKTAFAFVWRRYRVLRRAMVIRRLQEHRLSLAMPAAAAACWMMMGRECARRAAASDREQIGIALSDDDFTEQASRQWLVPSATLWSGPPIHNSALAPWLRYTTHVRQLQAMLQAFDDTHHVRV